MTRAPRLTLVNLPIAYPYPDSDLTVAGEIAHKKLMAELAAALAKKEKTP